MYQYHTLKLYVDTQYFKYFDQNNYSYLEAGFE